MRGNLFALAVVMGVVSAPAAADPPQERSGEAKRELKALGGKWRAVKFLHSDREIANEDLIVEFKGDSIDCHTTDCDGVWAAAVAALDPTTDPKCLDFKVRVGSGVLKKGSTYESIYQRDGDTLTWAFYHGRGKSRPPGFDKPTDRAVMVMVFKRVKD